MTYDGLYDSEVERAPLPSVFDYNWPSHVPFTPYADNFGFDATAEINMQRPGGGMVQFTVGSDDGVRLYVDDNLIIDHWTAHAYTVESQSIHLTPGKHTLRLQYWERTGLAHVKFDCDPDVLIWEEPSMPPYSEIPYEDSYILVYRLSTATVTLFGKAGSIIEGYIDPPIYGIDFEIRDDQNEVLHSAPHRTERHYFSVECDADGDYTLLFGNNNILRNKNVGLHFRVQ